MTRPALTLVVSNPFPVAPLAPEPADRPTMDQSASDDPGRTFLQFGLMAVAALTALLLSYGGGVLAANMVHASVGTPVAILLGVLAYLGLRTFFVSALSRIEMFR